jgi:hypothetical protein
VANQTVDFRILRCTHTSRYDTSRGSEAKQYLDQPDLVAATCTAICLRRVIAKVRDRANDDEDERNQDARNSAQVDLVDPALKADLQVNSKNRFSNRRLCHFESPFCGVLKGAQNGKGGNCSYV